MSKSQSSAKFKIPQKSDLPKSISYILVQLYNVSPLPMKIQPRGTTEALKIAKV